MPSRRLPTVQQRLARLEEGLRYVTYYVTDGQPKTRLPRSLSASGAGNRLLAIVEAIEAETDLREGTEPENPAA